MRDIKAALVWITDILKELHIPFQIAGGLAARAYGATRELEDIDIDIPEDQFGVLYQRVKEFVIDGPDQHQDEHWDILLMTINYHDQLIDIGGAYHTKIRGKESDAWRLLKTDFSKVEYVNLFGVDVPVIARAELIAYKKILMREVDVEDVKQIEQAQIGT